MTEKLALALLVSAMGANHARIGWLLDQAGSAQDALARPEAYARMLGEARLARLKKAALDADELQRTLTCEGVRLVMRGEAGYPPLLNQTAQPPHVLFVQGESDLSDAFPVAVVGTRQADEYGLRHTRAIARELAQAGVCVVSGLAMGVDAAAHAGALDSGGRTVAVLGGALDRFYPAANRPLARRILQAGGSIVSEFPMGMAPTRYSFLQRNRVIAGMSLGVLVTQGLMRSGALRTAHDALDEGREVFALPGDVDNALSQMPNRLIAEGAHLTTCARDILDTLVIQLPKGSPADGDGAQAKAGGRIDAVPALEAGDAKGTSKADKKRGARRAPKTAKPIPEGLSEPERDVLLALSGAEADFDALCEATRIPADDLGALLTMMELDGLVTSLPGLRYARA